MQVKVKVRHVKRIDGVCLVQFVADDSKSASVAIRVSEVQATQFNHGDEYTVELTKVK